MIFGEQQAEEIKTIKGRNITLQLSDADCDRLLALAGEHGLTVAELLQNFIGDLVDGTYSNGSDERMYAQSWFGRCGFGMFPENTLLRWLLQEGRDPDDFLTAWEENELYKEDPKKYCEDQDEEYDPEDPFWFESEVQDVMESWEPDGEPDMKKEIQQIRDYLADCQSFKG